MSLASELRNLLGASAALKDLVNEQIYPLTFPKTGATMPAVLYTEIDAIPLNDLDGHDKGLWQARLQIDCYGRNYDEAHDMADMVKAALPNSSATFRAVMLSRSDLFEEQKRIYRVTLDFSVWWTET